MAYDRVNVPLSGYTSMVGRFQTHVRHIDGAPLIGPALEMEWTEFAALFTATVSPGDGLAVKVHYGLLGHSIVFGISQVYMTNKGDGSYDLSVLDYNLVTAGRLVPSSPAVIEQLVAVYMDDVEVRRSDDSGFTPLVRGTDPQASIMPYELELKPLMDQNKAMHGGSMMDYTVVISCLFDRETADGEYRHGIGFHLRKEGSDLLSNAFDPSLPFMDKMADMANLCPPKCGKYIGTR